MDWWPSGTLEVTQVPGVQSFKQFQPTLALAFTNPLYALLLLLCPWLPKARQSKAVAQAFAAVSCPSPCLRLSAIGIASARVCMC